MTLMMEAVSSSEISVSIYQTTRCNIPDVSHLHTRRRENFKYHAAAIFVREHSTTKL
jgi:hypothetical protein